MTTLSKNPPAWIAIWIIALTHLSTGNSLVVNAQHPNTNIDVPVPGPPVPGPDLLKFTPEEIESAYEGKTQPEAVKMYLSIVRGGSMHGDEGWFGPAQTRFNWAWLNENFATGDSDQILAKNFKGPESVFIALDRNHDGQLQPEDLEWSDANVWVQQSYMVNRMFRKMDPNGDGRISSDEWNQFFENSTNSQLTFQQLREKLLGRSQGGLGPGDGPSEEILIQGLLAGEIGSLSEGPNLNDPAPDFELKTFDGRDSIRLSELFGTKPTVLVFGNFTCGPFRSMYPEVDELAIKYADQATFLGVYVREAHPTDGWAMQSNEKAGVQIAQPKSYDQRRDVASTCYAKLNMSIPLLVDDVDDSVGNAYSGMPARLYVVDPQGRVAYKGGRGPFGFKAGEMEQALQMTLLEFQAEPKPSSTAPPE